MAKASKVKNTEVEPETTPNMEDQVRLAAYFRWLNLHEGQVLSQGETDRVWLEAEQQYTAQNGASPAN